MVARRHLLLPQVSPSARSKRIQAGISLHARSCPIWRASSLEISLILMPRRLLGELLSGAQLANPKAFQTDPPKSLGVPDAPFFISDIVQGITPIRDGPAVGHHPAVQIFAPLEAHQRSRGHSDLDRAAHSGLDFARSDQRELSQPVGHIANSHHSTVCILAGSRAHQCHVSGSAARGSLLCRRQ